MGHGEQEASRVEVQGVNVSKQGQDVMEEHLVQVVLPWLDWQLVHEPCPKESV